MNSPQQPGSLRAEQIAQTRAALIAAGRALFGQKGFANTSVDELAREARLTTGALYHHFPTKAALFEAVFEQAHGELLTASTPASGEATDEVELLTLGFEAFLDAVLRPDVQRILIIDAPSVLGLTRFTELDERDTYPLITEMLRTAASSGRLKIDEPETMARLLLGTLTRAGMLIASSPTPRATRDQVATTIRNLLTGLAR